MPSTEARTPTTGAARTDPTRPRPASKGPLLPLILPITELRPRRPQSRAGRADVEHALPVGHRVPSFLHLGRVVPLGHLAQVGVLEVDALDLVGRQVARSVADR